MRKISLLCLAPILVSGCVSVLPEPVVPQGLYSLHSSGQSGAPIRLPLTVTVYEPAGSSLHLNSQIVFQAVDGRFSLVREAQWTEKASHLLELLVLEKLSNHKNAESEKAVSEHMGARTEIEIQWEVLDFHVRDSDAIARFRVHVMHARKRNIIDQFEVAATETYFGDAYDDGVTALVRAAHSAANDMSSRLESVLAEYHSALTADDNTR